MMQDSLFLQRLRIVTLENKIAYDEKFHKGVNIIRGQNSSGKSTIIRFIFFALGGAYNGFVPEALKCEYVMAEVSINEKSVITLKRYLDINAEQRANSKSPMYIYYGTLDDSLRDKKKDAWQMFGYNTTSDKRSFSNVLFEMLGLPEVKCDSNITMHQLLRLVYLDQESPTESLFYFERFDKELTRETTAEVLLGVYDEDLYMAKLDLQSVQGELKESKGIIKIANAFFANPMTISSAAIQGYLSNLADEIAGITEQITNIRDSTTKAKVKTREYEILQTKVSALRMQQLNLENDIKNLEMEIIDSKFFISTLSRKIEAIDSSIATRDYLDKLPLEYCPECLSKLDIDVPKGHCRLCKSPIDNTQGKAQALRIKLEIGFQIRESEQLLSQNIELKSKKDIELKSVKSSLRTTQLQLDSALKNVRTTADEQLDLLIQTKGFKEGEILQYKTLLETALQYENILKRNDELIKKESELTRFIKAKTELLKQRRLEVDKTVSQTGIYLLKHDELRQAEFQSVDDFTIDYKQNIAYISDKYVKLSASSGFYLKMAARFAIFLASLKDSDMRYPRLLFSDNMEDKGMEENRAKNFQRTIIKYLQETGKDNYQLIYATSMCAEEYDNDKYVIGEKYSEKNKSLKNL